MTTEPEAGEPSDEGLQNDDPLPPADHPLVGDRHEAVDLPIIEPSVARESVDADGRVGAVAYPFRVYEAEIEVDRPLLAPRMDRRVISVDRSRRLAVRADTLPAVEERRVEDVLVLPGELSPDQADEKAREAAFQWTLRSSILADAPDIEFARVVDAYKLFWLAERPGGDVIVDSVRGEEKPYEG